MPIRSALLNLSQQLTCVLEQLSEEEYCRPLSELGYNSLGQHFRHILEFFQCLQKGATSGGVIDYSTRPRNVLYEMQPLVTRQVFQETIRAVMTLDFDQPVMVLAEVGSSVKPCYSSTVGRELIFTFEHAIHHLAIIKIGLTCSFPHVELDSALGIAPSTLKARQRPKAD